MRIAIKNRPILANLSGKRVLPNPSCADEIVHLGKPEALQKMIAFPRVDARLECSLVFLVWALLSLLAPTCSQAQNWIPWANTLPLVSVQPTVLIGRMYPARPTIVSVHTSGDFAVRALEQSVKVQGTWTELVVPVQGPIPIGFALSMGYLFPSNFRSEESYTIVGGSLEQRTWGAETQMFNVQVSASYRLFLPVAVILGFRYDSFMINYMEPQNISDTGRFVWTQRASLNVTGDIPFAGLTIDMNFLGGANVKAGAIGLPTLPGDISYKEDVHVDVEDSGKRGTVIAREFRRGYFFEGFAEVSTPVYGRFQGGAFVKYNAVFGKAAKGAVSFYSSQGTLPSIEANVVFDRSSFIIGGTIAMSF